MSMKNSNDAIGNRILATYPAHRNLPHFTVLTTPADLYKSHRSSLLISILATYPAHHKVPHDIINFGKQINAAKVIICYHWNLSWARYIQSTLSHITPLSYILILSLDATLQWGFPFRYSDYNFVTISNFSHSYFLYMIWNVLSLIICYTLQVT
jgi:hypothetical protein